MNKPGLYLFILLITAMASCERDDLCIPSEAASPRLIIVFTDQANPDDRKPVESLQVRSTLNAQPAPLNSDGATILSQVDSIAIPLPPDVPSTIYQFERTLDEELNTDAVTLNYMPGEEYVNRACGFKAIYENLGFERIEEPNSQQWISQIIIREANVTSNQDIHVEVRH
jgi:hypothetical protein